MAVARVHARHCTDISNVCIDARHLSVGEGFMEVCSGDVAVRITERRGFAHEISNRRSFFASRSSRVGRLTVRIQRREGNGDIQCRRRRQKKM